MAQIHILDTDTIDKIAAGEVVERPRSVVKELVENSIDSGATIITVEIKNGGTKLIRVTDNGTGIEKEQVKKAFIPHATSKINDAEDLNHLVTLGFRGEALSSIAAVSRVELTSRTEDSLTGIHYVIEGGQETEFEEVGAPAGTTFIVRDLFYNTLPRLKFLKSESSEGSMVADLMEHLALSMPHISFNFIMNGTTRFSTSGRGDLKEVIFRIFGKETAKNLKEIEFCDNRIDMKVSGFLGLPILNRANRAGEIFFVNHRYIKSTCISKAVEEGYVQYLMQHKFPFCVINMEFDPGKIDVNVHPTKTEVRISEEKPVYDSLVEKISFCLSQKEMIDSCELCKPEVVHNPEPVRKPPELFERSRMSDISVHLPQTPVQPKATINDDFFFDNTKDTVEEISQGNETALPDDNDSYVTSNLVGEQISFMDNERLLSPKARRQYRLIGQLFKTYWLIEYEESLLIMDQHAAHEKVMYERMLSHFKERGTVPSQLISPPDIITLTNREKQILEDNYDRFTEMGFAIEEFGEHEMAIRSVPLDLFGASPREMVGEIITDLVTLKKNDTPDTIRGRIATFACKAAIKGNRRVSPEEIEELLDEMLTLENPYNCPHGRPTLITISEKELEKRFHRIV